MVFGVKTDCQPYNSQVPLTFFHIVSEDVKTFTIFAPSNNLIQWTLRHRINFWLFAVW